MNELQYTIYGMYTLNTKGNILPIDGLVRPDSKPIILILVSGNLTDIIRQLKSQSCWIEYDLNSGFNSGTLSKSNMMIMATGNGYYYPSPLGELDDHKIPRYLLPGIKEVIAKWTDEMVVNE